MPIAAQGAQTLLARPFDFTSFVIVAWPRHRECLVNIGILVAGQPPDRPQLVQLDSVTLIDDALARGNDVLYGLTAGIYSQDEGELQRFFDRAEAGVLYANRASGATTGAWPGIQSFCGWKGSGVSNKGGLGPYYLPQFMREQSRTIMR